MVGRGERNRCQPAVALLAEGVDRNKVMGVAPVILIKVALLAEGVDRNKNKEELRAGCPDVALLAEGVDRNLMSARPTRRWQCRPPRGGRG